MMTHCLRRCLDHETKVGEAWRCQQLRYKEMHFWTPVLRGSPRSRQWSPHLRVTLTIARQLSSNLRNRCGLGLHSHILTNLEINVQYATHSEQASQLLPIRSHSAVVSPFVTSVFVPNTRIDVPNRPDMSQKKKMMRELTEAMEKQRLALEMMSIRTREMERLSMYRMLGVRHDSDLWPFDVKKMIASHFQRGKRLATFLTEFGYVRRGRVFKFAGAAQLGLPNIVVKDSMAIEDLPTEVVNSMWLRIVLKRKEAARKASTTRWLNDCERKRKLDKVAKEGDPEHTAKRICEEGMDGTVFPEVDEFSLGGF